MKSNIYVNGRFLSRRMTGVDRFALELMFAIDRLLAGDAPETRGLSFKLCVPDGVETVPSFENVSIEKIGKSQGQMWEQVDLFRFVSNNDLLLSLCNTGPAFCRRQVVVIHDAATVRMPVAFSRSFRLWYRLLMPLLGRSAKRVLTVSEFSRSEIEQAFAIPGNKTSVVVEGGEHILRTPPSPDAVARFGLGDRPFVLAVSSMAAHKNFRLVLEALEHLPEAPFDIAIAGGANSKVFGEAGHLRSERIRWLGYVSDAELRSLYEAAMCFVFPSLYEGFGIPPLEAMHCGCPVLAARAASIPEVCGEAALYFDPRDARALADLLLKVAADESLRADLSERGRERIRHFSWERAARQVVSACREAIQ